MIIAIDGPAASGKGTLSKKLAAHYGYRHLDTGLLYRAVAKVLLDAGHPANDDWIGSSYVGYDARTDLADVERIEVVRGPGSVLYGTNAFSGVINVVPR